MKPSIILFGVSAAAIALRSILTAQVIAAATRRADEPVWPSPYAHLFPELLSLALVAAACGVIAACISIWRAASPLWVRATQVFGRLLFVLVAYIGIISQPSFR